MGCIRRIGRWGRCRAGVLPAVVVDASRSDRFRSSCAGFVVQPASGKEKARLSPGSFVSRYCLDYLNLYCSCAEISRPIGLKLPEKYG